MNENIFCCKDMKIFLDDPRNTIEYKEVFREYFISFVDRPWIIIFIYCPWCGKKLPNSLREEFFNTLEKEYNIETDIGEYKERTDIPKEFKSDEWWKKRKL